MAGDWIKMRNDLPDDPAVIAIASKLGLDEFSVIGRLHTLWAWADEQSRDGHAVGVTSAWLDRKVQRDGFADALVAVRWLEVTPDGLTIPNFENHNGETAKVRALGTRRKQRQRATDTPKSVPPVVTDVSRNPSREVSRTERDKNETREEKRREEIDAGAGAAVVSLAKPPAKAGKQKAPKPQPLPDGWTPSAAGVAKLAAEYGVSPGVIRGAYVDAFHDACRAKGYVYLDFDAAFRNCVRQDWPKLRQAKGPGKPPGNDLDDMFRRGAA